MNMTPNDILEAIERKLRAEKLFYELETKTQKGKLYFISIRLKLQPDELPVFAAALKVKVE